MLQSTSESLSVNKGTILFAVGEDEEFECASVQTCHSQDVKKVLWHPDRDVSHLLMLNTLRLAKSRHIFTEYQGPSCYFLYLSMASTDSHYQTYWSCGNFRKHL